MGYVLDWQGLPEPLPPVAVERVAPMGSVATVVDTTFTTIFRLEEKKNVELG